LSTDDLKELEELEASTDIDKFKTLLEGERLVHSDKKVTDEVKVLKSFLWDVAGVLVDLDDKNDTDVHFIEYHVLLRWIWILDNCCGDFDSLLKAVMLSLCKWGRGEDGKKMVYDIKPNDDDKLNDEPKNLSPRFKLADLLPAIGGLDLDDVIRDDERFTQMGFTRDFNEFNRKVLSKVGLGLSLKARSTVAFKNMPQEKKSLFYYFSSLARFGRDHGLKDSTYLRMMMVISNASTWEYEDVLQAFFMSMCKYKRVMQNKENKKEKKEKKPSTKDEENEKARLIAEEKKRLRALFMSMCTYKRDVNSAKEQDVTIPLDEEAKIKKARCE
jgi:hypothetical protein